MRIPVVSDDRIVKLLSCARKTFKLDATDLAFLCEAGSNNYRFAPIQAALAGAAKVYAITKDSAYGKARDIQADVAEWAQRFKVKDRIQFINALSPEIVSDCDVVCNSGHVRPITAEIVSWMKETAVIPLMWETWEFRPGEVDLDACRRRGILVMGTNERDPPLNLFRSKFFVIAKLLFDCGYDVYKDNILLCGGGPRGVGAVAYLEATECSFSWIPGGHWVAPEYRYRVVSAPEATECIEEFDALVIDEVGFGANYLSHDGLLDPRELVKRNPLLQVIHIAGEANEKQIVDAGLSLYPRPLAPQGYMTVSPDYLGPRAVIELVTAGLSVGATMAKARLAGYSPPEAERYTLEANPLAMRFPEGLWDVGE